MGIFARFRNQNGTDSVVAAEIDAVLGYLDEELEDENVQKQIMAMVAFMVFIFLIRLFTASRLQALSGKHTLDLSALNDACMYKEVFLAYLNAALLEPVLAIGGMQEVVGRELVVNMFTLGSICWWTWMVTDAFDYTDVAQHFKYHVDLREEALGKSKYDWLQLKSIEEDAKSERQTLIGSVKRDIALWFCLACIGAAWLPGAVSHRDVMHAYAIVILWIITHHNCRRATTWSAGYFVTFLFPSSGLMPMEFCLPLMDTFDFVDDIDSVSSYRDYLKERTGVDLIIRS